jgi:hypothetical protein
MPFVKPFEIASTKDNPEIQGRKLKPFVKLLSACAMRLGL